MLCNKYNSLFTNMKEVNRRPILVKCGCRSLTHKDYLVHETFPKRQQMYKAIYEAINTGKVPKKLVGMSAMRWLSISGAMKIVVDQWLELKMHFDVARCQDRCYSAKVLTKMYRDEQTFSLVTFLSPLVAEFNQINKIYQCENPDPVVLHKNLSSFVTSLMKRVIMPPHASPECSNWEDHVLHVRTYGMGGVPSKIDVL